jgi:nicotinate-nucleotide--dimethylbenzimidazole phosphoribosyltransferase
VIVDGFICGAAALAARAFEPAVLEGLIFSHVSAEPAHRHMLRFLGARPLLDLDLRLGEGTGAALAMAMLGDALELYNGMATFADAGVTNRD